MSGNIVIICPCCESEQPYEPYAPNHDPMSAGYFGMIAWTCPRCSFSFRDAGVAVKIRGGYDVRRGIDLYRCENASEVLKAKGVGQ